MAESTIRVGLVDDDALVRHALGTLLGRVEGLDVRWAHPCGEDAVAACLDPEAEVDVLLTDMHMPGKSGLDVIDELRERLPHLPVIVLTTAGDTQTLIDAMGRGARGYFVKDDDPLLIGSGIKQVLAGQKAFSPTATEAVLAAASSASLPSAPADAARPAAAPPQVTAPPRGAEALPAPLTPRELQVLELVAESMTNKQIARRLCVSEATVKTHVSVLIAKLGVTDRVGAALWAHRHGIV